MVIEYKGANFHGFQKQPGGVKTVQGCLEETLTKIVGAEVKVEGAGRTDAGVHAWGQVIGFELPEEHDLERLARSLNRMLAPDISVRDFSQAPQGFDPRRDARYREYRYLVLRRKEPSPLLSEFSYHHPLSLYDELIKTGARLLLGVHEFSAFCCKSEGLDCNREVFLCEWEKAWGDLYWLRIRANAFLYKMARVTTGALLKLGRGDMTLEELKENLSSGSMSCCDPLPPQGLFLWEVGY